MTAAPVLFDCGERLYLLSLHGFYLDTVEPKRNGNHKEV